MYCIFTSHSHVNIITELIPFNLTGRRAGSDGRSGVVGARGEPGVGVEGEREAEGEAEGEAGGVPLTGSHAALLAMNAPQAPQALPPPQAPTFPFDIPSVSQKNPGIPVPILGLLDLNCMVQSGQPLDYAQVKNAKASAEALKGIHGKVVFTYV